MVSIASSQTSDHAESAKRRQILEGARAVFLREGFDAASMGDIAREAKVSKGTLYVYFDSKEDLFQSIVQEECETQAERVFALDSNDHDVEAVLTRLGRDFIRFLGEPHRISSFRTVIAIAERMPELGRRFYAMGPTSGIGRVARYLEGQVNAGVLAVPDCELAAAQFLDSCKSTIFQAMLFNARERPSDDRISHVVATAVSTFLAAYRR